MGKRRAGFWVAALALASLMPGVARAENGASDWFVTDQGQVRLVAAAPDAGAAAHRELGLEFRLAPHWKIYWRSPGDAGYPPRLDWAGSTNLAGARSPGRRRSASPCWSWRPSATPMRWSCRSPRTLARARRRRSVSSCASAISPAPRSASRTMRCCRSTCRPAMPPWRHELRRAHRPVCRARARRRPRVRPGSPAATTASGQEAGAGAPDQERHAARRARCLHRRAGGGRLRRAASGRRRSAGRIGAARAGLRRPVGGRSPVGGAHRHPGRWRARASKPSLTPSAGAPEADFGRCWPSCRWHCSAASSSTSCPACCRCCRSNCSARSSRAAARARDAASASWRRRRG